MRRGRSVKRLARLIFATWDPGFALEIVPSRTNRLLEPPSSALYGIAAASVARRLVFLE
jgi:hypothetical protein